MRIARIVLVICFLAASLLYGFAEVKDRMFTDHTAPVIHDSYEDQECSITVTEEELLEGITAEDNQDGDVTKSVVITGLSEFVSKNTRKVYYAAFDESGNVGTYARNIIYTDYESPRFTKEEPFIYSGNVSASAAIEGIEVNDCLDGNICGRIKAVITSYEDYTNEPAVLTVSNSAGDEITANVILQFLEGDEVSNPRPWLDQYFFYCKAGSSVNIRSHIQGVWYNNNGRTFEEVNDLYSAEDMKIDTSNVDYSMPGSYVVKVTLPESEDHPKAADAFVTVMVLEGE